LSFELAKSNSNVVHRVPRVGIRMSRKVISLLLLVVAVTCGCISLAEATHTELHAEKKLEKQKHGALLRELQETTSASRKEVLEKEIAESRLRKHVLKYMIKGHSEEAATKIATLERRLHDLQNERGSTHGLSAEEKADKRLELKALRADLSRMKFQIGSEDGSESSSSVKSNVKSVKELRAQAKALRTQIRTESDPAKKQKLRKQLDALYD